jgi:N-acyl-D-amino-acid deacylase
MKKNHLLLTVFLLSLFQITAQEAYDLLIINGRVMDGTGNPWFRADVGVKGNEIVKVGRIDSRNAKKIIDARGKIVAPGFIDIHSHGDDGAFGNRSGIRADDPMLKAAHNMVMQGVTTIVVNHDGRSPRSIPAQRKELEEEGVGPNVALMIGHNTIRRLAMSPDYQRFSNEEELERMKESIREGMEAGAFGLSAALEYVPGRWSNTEEVVELVKEVKEYGGVYIVHERFSGSDPMWFLPSRDGESPGNAIDNIREVIRIAEETGVPSCATHIKVKGADYWGVSNAIVKQVNRARARGIEVWADQYPYNTTGSDGNTVLLPDWALMRNRWDREAEDGEDKPKTYKEALARTLANKENHESLEKDILRGIERRGGAENVVVFDYPNEDLIGKSIAQIAEEKEMNYVEVAYYLQLEGDPERPGGARLRGFSLNEQDIEILAAQPWVITASDAGIARSKDRPVHARYYGTFPRKIAYYAKERGVLSVESAVRSMTSLPAQFMGFQDRGMLREGYKADITIFDLDEIKDKATFFEPHQYPEGIYHVIVNGTFLVEDSQLKEHTLPGEVLHVKNSRRYAKIKP